MNRVLEAIAAERSELSARLAALEEIERLYREVAAVEQASSGMDLAVDAGDEPATNRVRVPASKAAPAERPVRALPPARRSQLQPRRAQATPSEMKQRAALVLAALRDLEPCKSPALAERTTLPAHMVKDALVRLREAGLVRMIGPANRHALWHLTATLDRQTAEKHGTRDPAVQYTRQVAQTCCRDDILATIRSEPDAWTEQRITDTGVWDREQVADACGYLLNDGLIVLNADGTYRPAVLGLEAAA